VKGRGILPLSLFDPLRALARKPFNPQSLISHLTNSNGCGNILAKVLLTVSPLRPPFPPQPRVFPYASLPLTTHYPLSPALYFHTLTNCFSRNPFIFTTICVARGCHLSIPISALCVSVANLVFSATCRLLRSLCPLLYTPVLCFQSFPASFCKMRGWGYRIPNAFTGHPGWGVLRVNQQALRRGALKLSTVDCRLLTAPRASRVAQCAALAVEEAPAGDRVKHGGACPRRRCTLCVHRCRCFFSPATHTEPPAGVLAGLPVAAMPTRNSCRDSASASAVANPFHSAACRLCVSVPSPAPAWSGGKSRPRRTEEGALKLSAVNCRLLTARSGWASLQRTGRKGRSTSTLNRCAAGSVVASFWRRRRPSSRRSCEER